MPCNLAVTITKATVLPDHLTKLLTPEVVEQIVLAYLKQHPTYQTYLPLRSRKVGESVIFYLSSLAYRITITGGEVAMNFPRYAQEQANTLGDELTALLARGADRLFAQQVKTALTKKFGQVQQTTATVENQGQPQKVTLLTFEV